MPIHLCQDEEKSLFRLFQFRSEESQGSFQIKSRLIVLVCLQILKKNSREKEPKDRKKQFFIRDTIGDRKF